MPHCSIQIQIFGQKLIITIIQKNPNETLCVVRPNLDLCYNPAVCWISVLNTSWCWHWLYSRFPRHDPALMVSSANLILIHMECSTGQKLNDCIRSRLSILHIKEFGSWFEQDVIRTLLSLKPKRSESSLGWNKKNKQVVMRAYFTSFSHFKSILLLYNYLICKICECSVCQIYMNTHTL